MTQQKDGSPRLALVKLDFSTGMKRGSDASRAESPAALIDQKKRAKSSRNKDFTSKFYSPKTLAGMAR